MRTKPGSQGTKEPTQGKICRVVLTEVGKLTGATGAVVMRVEHLPLAELPPDEQANVTVFILDQRQAAELDAQLLSACAPDLNVFDSDC